MSNAVTVDYESCLPVNVDRFNLTISPVRTEIALGIGSVIEVDDTVRYLDLGLVLGVPIHSVVRAVDDDRSVPEDEGIFCVLRSYSNFHCNFLLEQMARFQDVIFVMHGDKCVTSIYIIP